MATNNLTDIQVEAFIASLTRNIQLTIYYGLIRRGGQNYTLLLFSNSP